MNKRTVAVDKETYQLIIKTIQEGFVHDKVHYQPNERIAAILMLEYNLGIRVGDILKLTMKSFVRDGSRWRFDIYEEKTGKHREFTVPDEVFHFIQTYAYQNKISPEARLFPIIERTVMKHLQATCRYLNLENIGTHSMRKAFATNLYNSTHSLELVRTVLQHSSSMVTTRYIGISSKQIEDALVGVVDLCQNHET